jgi:hypothetical protein
MKSSDKRFLLALEAGTDFVLEYAAGNKRRMDRKSFERAMEKYGIWRDGATWSRHDGLWTIRFQLACPIFSIRFSSFGPDEAAALLEAREIGSASACGNEKTPSRARI